MKHNITVTWEEIIILSELISRINESNILKNFFEDQSEQRVLWNLECLLEKNTSNIFSKDYKIKLQEARDNIRDEI